MSFWTLVGQTVDPSAPATGRLRVYAKGVDLFTIDENGVVTDLSAVEIHALGGAEHSADTIANLNAKISDATLDDSSASRTPSGPAGGGLGGTYPNPTVNAQDLTFAVASATTTTALLGKAALYPITTVGITITISTVDITDGRAFEFKDETGLVDSGTGKVRIELESGTIDGQPFINIIAAYGGLAAYARGGNLFTR